MQNVCAPASCRVHAEQAAQPLLRMVVHTVLAVSSCSVQVLDSQLPDPSMKQPYLEAQVARLKICKRLLLAMQASSDCTICFLPLHASSQCFYLEFLAGRLDSQSDEYLRSYGTSLSPYPSQA